MQINPQKINPNYPLNPMQIWHWSVSICLLQAWQFSAGFSFDSQGDFGIRKTGICNLTILLPYLSGAKSL